jgi:signal transduction histidine kinase/CheY-like chemotaxis protein
MKISNRLLITLSMVTSALIIVVLMYNLFIAYEMLPQGQMSEVFFRLGTATLFSFFLFLIVLYLFKNSTPRVEIVEKIIEKKEESPSNFLANISHEIRTPLNGILGFADLLKGTKLDTDQQGFVDIIQESSGNLLHIVNDILDFSKVASGKMELEKVAFNPIEKLEHTIDSYSAKVVQKNIELGFYIDPKLPIEIVGDPSKLSQVMLNLLGNAVKFTKEHGLVNISITKSSETAQEIGIEFSVKDSGRGIESDKLDTIFEAFSQESVSTSREFGGTGLGLTISSQFVALMGGKLEIESRVGEGTRFFFTIVFKKTTHSHPKALLASLQKNVGYVVPDEESPYKEIDQNLAAYIKETKSKFSTYSKREIFALSEGKLPDILFVNHRYAQDEKLLDRFFGLKTKIVLITCADAEKIKMLYSHKIENFIFKPINFSKILKVLEEKSQAVEREYKTTEGETISVLVAEDNLINQKLVLNILSKMNIKVTLANNGKEAFELYQQNSYHMILMDIQMPIMKGTESSQKIVEYEQRNQLEHTPIIALTANNLQSDINHYFENGMDDYLSKPIKLDALKGLIAKYSIKKEERFKTPSKYILLYKKTEVGGKIYSAMLQNLGYIVDTYHSEEKFQEQVTNKKYQMILFDTKFSETINETDITLKLIKESTAVSFAFTENREYQAYCHILSPQSSGEELRESLEIC